MLCTGSVAIVSSLVAVKRTRIAGSIHKNRTYSYAQRRHDESELHDKNRSIVDISQTISLTLAPALMQFAGCSVLRRHDTPNRPNSTLPSLLVNGWHKSSLKLVRFDICLTIGDEMGPGKTAKSQAMVTYDFLV